MQQSVSGKIIVITGGSSGIGAAAAKILTEKGAELIITGRSEETKHVAAEIGCEYFLVDYSSFTEVRNFAEKLLAKYPRIDVLVNNVGGIIGERRITEDGHQMTLQVNHLSGFLLTNLLQKRLEASNGMVLNTSSIANTMGKIDFNDMEREESYHALKVYGAAKLMNILHAMEISRRFNGVSAASFHPGTVSTGFAREGKGFLKWIYEGPLKHLFLISPKKGADTLIWLIEGQPGIAWNSGGYYYKRKPGRKNKQANERVAQQLWETSDALIEGKY